MSSSPAQGLYHLVHSFPFSYLTGCYDNKVRLWSSSGNLLQSLGGHGGPIKSVRWVDGGEESVEGEFLSGSQDQYIHIWKVGL